MKTIFVTINEFLANGGVLEKGRIIYREERRHFDLEEFSKNELLNNSLEMGEYLEQDETTKAFLVKNQSFRSMPILGSLGYIKIEAQPNYK